MEGVNLKTKRILLPLDSIPLSIFVALSSRTVFVSDEHPLEHP